MNGDEVLAVVVSYNGGPGIRQTVEALRTQLGQVYVVDNGSDAESLAVLDPLERETGVCVRRLGENRGVGHALNLGVLRARETGAKWLLTMDQDSLVNGSMIPAYIAALDQNPTWVCLAPMIAVNQGSIRGTEGGIIEYAITSGNLVRVTLFDEIGLYDEGFFIDCIDFDFSLRVRRAGHAVHRVVGARMQHQLGEAIVIPRALRKYYALHSPFRRYYMSRNYLYMAERYLLRFPKFIVKLGLAQLLLTVLVGFLDPHPLRSYRAIGQGVRDYLLRRTGPHPEAAR